MNKEKLMAIDFNKQKYMFLNGVRYLISDIKGFQVIRKKWKYTIKKWKYLGGISKKTRAKL